MQPDGVRIFLQRPDTKGDVFFKRHAEFFGTFADVMREKRLWRRRYS